MSTRVQRVEQLLRREVAAMLLRGDVKDPRVHDKPGISITGVKVSADLSVARVFVDVLDSTLDVARVLAGLNAASGVMRSHMSKLVKLRRIPSLSFERDPSIEHGAAIERALAEIREEDERRSAESPATELGSETDSNEPAAETQTP